MLSSQNKNGPIVLISRDISFIFPSGYGYLAGYLKEKNEEVKILVRPNTEENYNDLVKKIIELKPLLVGFGTIYPDLYPVKKIIKLLNDAGRNFPIVIGGQMVSPTPEFSIEVTGADYGVIGEGEIILYNLVKALRNDYNTKDVKGLVINNGGEKIITGPGEFIKDLTKLPKVPYDIFPKADWLRVGRIYMTMPQPHNQYNDRTVTIHGGRGCPFRCNFCYHHSIPRYRPIKLMLEEADELIKKFNANHIFFDDDLAIVSPERARQLAEGIPKLQKKVEYSVSARFDILERIDDELLLAMKKSGLRTMSIGVESGSQRILDIINKKITVEQMLAGFERLTKVGILPNSCIMIGQKTETNEDVQKSMDLMHKVVKMNKNMNWSFSVATPFPGSDLYKDCFEADIFKTHYDFFNNFFKKNLDLVQVTGNLSAMSDEEVIGWLEKFKQARKKARKEAVGPLVYKIENQRARAHRLNDRLYKKYFTKLSKNIPGKLIIKVYSFLYDIMQIGFEKTRLYLLGVKKY